MTDNQNLPDRESEVSLREITEATLSSILKLNVTEAQTKFVASNSISIAQAYFSKIAWFRAIYADDTPVGFLMLEDQPEKPEYYLWRMMIDIRYQRMGFGRKAMAVLFEHVKTRPNATELLTSVVQEEGGPQEFYESIGFVLTGEYEEGEAMMSYKL